MVAAYTCWLLFAHGAQSTPAIGSGLSRPQLVSWRGGAAGFPGTVRQRPGLLERVADADLGMPVHAAPESVRERFVERVYRTLSVQLLGTMLLCWFALTCHPSVLVDILRQRGATLAALVAPALVTTVMFHSPHARKTWPWNYALLALFTASEALVLSLVMLLVPREIVMRAGLTTAAVVGWLSLYARSTKRDLTRTGPTVLRGLLALIVLEVAQLLFFRRTPLLHSLYSAGGALAFAAMLVINTQRIVGGSSQHATIAPDEHILASVLLYSDIAALFVQLLSLMANSGDERRRDDGGGWQRSDRGGGRSGFAVF